MTKDELLDELMDAFERSFPPYDETTAPPDLEKYIDVLPKDIKFYLSIGSYAKGIIYYNYVSDTFKPRSKGEHICKPLCMIDLDSVVEFFKEYQGDSEEKDWEDFKTVIDEKGEVFKEYYSGDQLKYLIYFRDDCEFCYYDIDEKKLVETKLFYDVSFSPDNKDDQSDDSTDLTIVYNSKEDRYGILNGIDVSYDEAWLKSYNDFKKKFGRKNVTQIIEQFETKEKNFDNKMKFLADNMKRFEYMNEILNEWMLKDSDVPIEIKAAVYDDITELAEYMKKLSDSANIELAERAGIIFEMHLYEEPYDQILNGKKTFELRLNDEKRKSLKKENIIRFSRINDKWKRSFYARVKDIRYFDDFTKLYEAATSPYDKLTLEACGFKADISFDEFISRMRRFYSAEQEQKYGVIAIEIEVIEK